jgi:hypothetical protein
MGGCTVRDGAFREFGNGCSSDNTTLVNYTHSTDNQKHNFPQAHLRIKARRALASNPERKLRTLKKPSGANEPRRKTKGDPLQVFTMLLEG